MKRIALVLLLLIAVPFAFACGDDDNGSSGSLKKLTIMLDWTPNTNHAGLYIARDKGWYKDAGFDVNIVEPASGGVEAVVGTGKADFGISVAEQIIPARAQGVPIVSLGAIIQHNTSSLMSLTKTGINRPKDLAGKTYGGFGGALETALIKKFVSCDGGDPNSVKFIDVGDVDYLVGMEQKRFDFVWIFDAWDAIRAREIEHKEINTLPFIKYTDCIPDWYTPVLATSESMIKDHPDIVRKFMDATSRGYEYAMKNPADAAAILSKAAPEADKALMLASAKYLATRYADQGRQWGKQDLDVWTKFEQFLRDAGLTDKKVDVSKAFTNDFLPKK
jgi:ABC-type nitrate/sulfonate/bicarbonate transport system substrate-binding protein